MKKLINMVLAHKIISGIVIVVLVLGGYYGYKSYFSNSASQTSYVLGTVTKGTIVSSISGSGQVSASSEVELKPKASGDVVYVGVKKGQEVKAGAVLVQLDATTAVKSVRDAQANLESAKISLQKLEQPADALTITQAENSLASAQETKTKAENDLVKAYEDGFTTISDAFLDLPTVIVGLHDLLFDTDYSQNMENIDYYTSAAQMYDSSATKYHDSAYQAYQTAKAAYDINFSDYKATNRTSSNEDIESLIQETYSTTKNISDALKSANDLIQFYKDQFTKRGLAPNSLAETHLATLNSYISETNTHLSSLFSIKQTITNDQLSIVNAGRTIIEKTESLADLKAGADALDVKSQQLSITQKENALLDAQATLANYYVRAPFDGVVASIDVVKGDAASSGAAVATLISKQQMAEISLNEVDVAKVKVGQKATLTFDAVSDLSIAGQVADVDIIGTVSQGVVNYTVKIGFDTEDERVKPGMSVAASIITDIKQDVLLVPSSAVKTSSGSSYVLIPNETVNANNTNSTGGNAGVILATAPRQQAVQTGLSDDTNTEITSGLNEGDQIIVKTVTSSTSSSKSSSTKSILSTFGGGGPGR